MDIRINEKSLSKEELLQYLCIIKKGPLLGNANYEWLDESFDRSFTDIIKN